MSETDRPDSDNRIVKEDVSGVELTPVAETNRIRSVDVLRGVALLGILVINIDFFAFPSAIFFDPSIAGGFDGINLLEWHVATTFFLQKMMAIFSMLFGAGLVMMYERFEARGRRFGRVYYRRMLWLLLIGLAHSYLIWYGDVLVTYALCGLLLFLFRRRKPRTLLILGIVVLLFGMALQFGAGVQFSMLRDASAQAAADEAAGRTSEGHIQMMADAWEEVGGHFSPTDEDIAAETEAYRGGFLSALKQRVPETIMMQTQAMFFWAIWRAGGLMLLGMAFMKLGVFSGMRSTRFYVILSVVGYVLGLPLSLMAQKGLIANSFDVVHRFMVGNQIAYVASVLVALGHVGLVMLAFKKGLLSGLLDRLASVGRTALTNYLLQSLICTTVFYGYGGGLFNRVERGYFPLFILGVWAVQLVFSHWWLQRYRFGPMEWVWRSLTYWRRQAARISAG